MERILENPQWSWEYKGLYRYPDIPYKKLVGAIGAYAPGVKPDDVLVLVDDTVFGSAKDGLLVTREGIYSKKSFQQPQMVRFTDIRAIAPGSNARMMVNDREFFKADLVDHFAIGVLAARVAAVLKLDESPDEGGAESRTPRAEGLGTKLDALNRLALAHVHQELGTDLLLVDELLQRQYRRVGPHLATIKMTARRAATTANARARVDADTLEMAHLILLVLHFYSMSQLPEDFKEEMGEDLFQLYAIAEAYQEGYRRAFFGVVSKGFELDEESMRMSTLMFFHRDGSGELELKVPRRDAVVSILEHIGLERSVAIALRTDVEQDVVWWLSAIADMPDEDEGDDGSDGDGGAEDENNAVADYYQVLGIRVRASATEIELAFKGRRSQYHPDRYAKESEETILWATREMQRVNEAYTVLSDEKKRASYDAQRGSAVETPGRAERNEAPKSSSPRPHAQAPRREHVPELAPDVREYFSRLDLPHEDRARIHVAPYIAPDKLRNSVEARKWASKSYAAPPLVLVDDTLGGGAREGLLISDQCISFKALFLEPKEYLMRGGFKGGFDVCGSKITRMGDENKDFVHVSKQGVQAICTALNSFLDDLREWHMRRAEAGDAASAHFVSSSCMDRQESLRWLRRAAEGGLRVAQHNLGVELQSRDTAEAFHWFSLAVDQGCGSSRERLKAKRFDSFRTDSGQ